jgi:flagella basal body P-ring formation protein FlgA
MHATSARTRAITLTVVGLTAVGLALLWPATVLAAQLRLRRECRPAGPVVTLGDVADVLAAEPAEADRLAAVELFPTPPAGTKRFLQLRRLQDLLLSRGVRLLEHPISGASQIAVLGWEGPDEGEPAVKGGALPDSTVKEAQRRVSDAVVRYLQEQVSAAEPWRADVRLRAAQARWVASSEDDIVVRGGSPPWVGSQRFEAVVRSPDGLVRFDVEAEVTRVLQRVVAARSLPRGATIRAADVRLQPTVPMDANAEGFRSIDEVVGKQTTRAVPPGKVLDRSSVRQPLLVRRGEVITVTARSAGVRVRSTAKARDDGGLGDLIEVESLPDRAAYFARVSGLQEVEVYAQPAQADRTAPVGGPTPRVSAARRHGPSRATAGAPAHREAWSMQNNGVPNTVRPVAFDVRRQIVTPEPRNLGRPP